MPQAISKSGFGRLLTLFGAFVFGALVTAIIAIVLYLDSRPALSIWHTVHLTEEFQAGSDVESFAEYLALEHRLFQELDAKIYDKVPKDQAEPYSRYSKGSRTDPTSTSRNWNRSFELEAQDPNIAVLLLHGLSDSPYSMRSLGLSLHKAGAHVVGLRIPGHGTAPSGLTTTTFKDMAAAVDVAVLHLHETLGISKIYVVGYSNGGALAVDYATRAVQDAALPELAGLILLSPEIGVSPAARLAAPLTWFGRSLGIQKLAWASIGPEYDPYKYNSFALRADLTAWNATQTVKAHLQTLQDDNLIDRLPPILAFQSAADATVQAPVLISELFDKLQGPGHHLVLFDGNQVFGPPDLLTGLLEVSDFLEGAPRAYTASVVTNAEPGSLATVLRERPAGARDVLTTPLDLSWPPGVYSLTHIALPFEPNDPVYGIGVGPVSPTDQLLGFRDVPMYGERNSLKIPRTGLLRQHWNPFHSTMTEIVLDFTRQ